MTLTLLAVVAAALLAAMYLYERREPRIFRARAARSTLREAIRRMR